MAKRLSGKEVAQAMQKELARRAEELKRNDIRPTLAIIRVGEKESDIAFSIGQRVRHAVFGAGTVTGVDRDKCAHLVQFDSIDTPRNISFRAKLEKI